MKKESSKRDQDTAVLEELYSDFRAFGEVLTGVRDDVKGLKTKVGNLEKDMQTVKNTIILTNKNVGGLRSDMQTVKGELATIRHNQVTRDEFKLLENRVLRLEGKVK